MVGQERLERSTGTISGCCSHQIELLAVVETEGIEPSTVRVQAGCSTDELDPQVGRQPACVTGRAPYGGLMPNRTAVTSSWYGGVLPLHYQPKRAKRRSQRRIALVDLVGSAPTTSCMPYRRAPGCATGPDCGRPGRIRTDNLRYVAPALSLLNHGSMVDRGGLEPPTSCVRCRRSPI